MRRGRELGFLSLGKGMQKEVILLPASPSRQGYREDVSAGHWLMSIESGGPLLQKVPIFPEPLYSNWAESTVLQPGGGQDRAQRQCFPCPLPPCLSHAEPAACRQLCAGAREPGALGHAATQ